MGGEFAVDVGKGCTTGEVCGTCDCTGSMTSDTGGKPFGKTILKSLIQDQSL